MTNNSLLEIKLFQDLWDKLEAIESKIDSIKNENLKKPADLWINSKQAAKVLDISTRTLQTYRNQGVIPFSQYSRDIRYRPEDLHEFRMQYFLTGSRINSQKRSE